MEKKVIIHKGEDATAALDIIQQHSGAILADYGASMLVMLEEEGIQDIETHKYRSRELPTSAVAQVNSFNFDASQPELQSTSAMAFDQALPSGRGHHLLQVAGPMHADWKAQLEQLGVTIYEKMAAYTHLIDVDSHNVDDLQALAFVEAVMPYLPAFKINESLLTPQLQNDLTSEMVGLEASPLPMASDELASADAVPEESMLSPMSAGVEPVSTASNEAKVGNIELVLFKPTDQSAATAAIQANGVAVISATDERIVAFASQQMLPKLAAIPQIRAINPYAPARLHNNIATDIINVANTQSRLGLDGRGQIVAVADTGLDNGRNDATILPDFAGRIVSLRALGRPGDAKGPSDASDIHNHGTHVAGSVLGNGASSNGKVQGMAPAARLVFQSIMDVNRGLGGLPPNLGTGLFKDARDDGAHIHSNSWGSDVDGAYGVHSRQVDEFAFNNREFLIVFAAGNEGPKRVGSPGTAKNALTVGASESIRFLPGVITFPNGVKSNYDTQADNRNDVAFFSSKGPVNKNRQKPDVVAPGTWILSTRSSVSVVDIGNPTRAVGRGLPGNPIFGSGNKNAPALPLGAGANAAENHYYSNGTSMAAPITSGTCALVRQYLIEQRNHIPSAALLKALMVNGAVDMGMGIPHNGQGWGRIDLSNTLHPDGINQVQFDDSLNKALSAGDFRAYDVHVVSPAKPLVVTLVWRDPPNETIQNELFLRVTHVASGTTFTTSENINNIRNNVQKVVVDAPATGQYQIEVESGDISRGIPEFLPALRQDYALVVANGMGLSGRIIIGDVLFRRNRFWNYSIIGVRVLGSTGEPLSPADGVTVNLTIRQGTQAATSGVLPYYRRGQYHIWRFKGEGFAAGAAELNIELSENGQLITKAHGSLSL